MTKSTSPEYRIWQGMRNRCRNANHRDYKNYGGRGISVCERWDSFENFFTDMGPRPSEYHSIDRINNNGNYEPTNCRWAMARQQASNRRVAVRRPKGSVDRPPSSVPKPKSNRGRPPSKQGILPSRILGRVADAEWREMQDAAESSGLPFTKWALNELFTAAKTEAQSVDE